MFDLNRFAHCDKCFFIFCARVQAQIKVSLRAIILFWSEAEIDVEIVKMYKFIDRSSFNFILWKKMIMVIELLGAKVGIASQITKSRITILKIRHVFEISKNSSWVNQKVMWWLYKKNFYIILTDWLTCKNIKIFWIKKLSKPATD